MTDTNTAERDALMDLIDAYAEARHVGGCHTYNAKTAEARAKVVDSLAASAGSEPVAPAAPPMDGEIALIEKAVKRVGIKSLLNHGAGSLVYSEGVEGVTQDDLLAYTREIALHCVVALGSPPEGMAGWKPIETAPKDAYVLLWADVAIGPPLIVQGCWFKVSRSEKGWVDANGDIVMATHWMPLPAPPASEAKEPI